MQTKYTYKDIIIAILTHNENLHCPPSQADIAKILGITRQGIGGRIKDNTEFETDETYKILDYYNVNSQTLDTPDHNKIIANITQDNNNTTCPYRLENNCPCREQFNIPYYEDLPEDLKKNDFTSCHIDREIIENYWKYNKDDLRIIPVFTNHLTYYPDERMPFGHICVMDIASTDINKAGVYCFTTNSGIFIRKLNLLLDGSVQFMDYSEPTPKVSKTITPEQLEDVNFTVRGRVFKCISTRI